MRPNNGEYISAIDHLRVLAAFMVFSWHFLHAFDGYPISFSFTPIIFPFSIFNEGHTGVALFMVLSGFLFSSILDGNKINYVNFLFNRVVRLFPLLFFVFFVQIFILLYANGFSWAGWNQFLMNLLYGFVKPVWPQGAWSIAVELQFYIVVPFMIFFSRNNKYLLFLVILFAIFLRICLFAINGEVQHFSYLTLLGRIDQFMLGMLAWSLRNFLFNKNEIIIFLIFCFMLIFNIFDHQGGFYRMPSYPSTSIWWVFLPTLEGLAYALLITWYCNFVKNVNFNSVLSVFLEKAALLSYSMYLIHFFFVFDISKFIHENLFALNNFYIALFFSFVSFLLILPICAITYYCIERPFLKLRKRYII